MRHLTPILLLLLLLVACPKPNEKLDPAICDEGYHPCGPDSQECCLDTTSHEFTWELDSLGIYGSELRDAVIINESDIWVVGELTVYDPDSVNGTPEAYYNAAHWDGAEWNYHAVYNSGMLYGAFAFGSDDIYFTNGISVLHYNGQSFERLWQADYEQYGYRQVIKIWGTSPNNIYFAGYGGCIVHYDGSTFTRFDTGIDTDFSDITGTTDGEHVFLVGNPLDRYGEDVVLHSQGDPFNWVNLVYPPSRDSSDGLHEVYSADVLGDTLYVPSFDGLWKFNFNTGESDFDEHSKQSITQLYLFTGVETSSDIFFGGINMDYSHFNGDSYLYKNEIEPLHGNVAMKGGDYNGQVAIMVGYFNSWEHALIARGYRN